MRAASIRRSVEPGKVGRCRSSFREAFTLIELITVVAIVAILAAILVPSVASVRLSADKAKAKVQFNQWASAIESFRGEYGYYPVFDSSHKVNGGAGAADHVFHDLLAGRRRNGSWLVAGSSARKQNPKLIAFYRFSETDFGGADTEAGALLHDAFGNTDIAVIVDRDLDGRITTGDCSGAWPTINGLVPEIAGEGVRATTIFYSAGAPGSGELLCSWK